MTISAEPIIYGLIFVAVLVLVEGLYLTVFGKSISLNNKVNRRLDLLEKGAGREQVLEHLSAEGCMVDVRSPQEFSGELTHMPDYPQEGTLRGGHIPGAKSVPWKRAANDDGTFKGLADLRAIYEGEKGLAAGDDVIAYCRIGERSSHTWFVLTYLLGFKNVRNYDGSWSEWGNAVRLPIAVGAE